MKRFKIEFDVIPYVNGHGRNPRGRGAWAFEVEGHVLWAQGTLGEAKRDVSKQIRDLAPVDRSDTVMAKVLS